MARNNSVSTYRSENMKKILICVLLMPVFSYAMNKQTVQLKDSSNEQKTLTREEQEAIKNKAVDMAMWLQNREEKAAQVALSNKQAWEKAIRKFRGEKSCWERFKSFFGY